MQTINQPWTRFQDSGCLERTVTKDSDSMFALLTFFVSFYLCHHQKSMPSDLWRKLKTMITLTDGHSNFGTLCWSRKYTCWPTRKGFSVSTVLPHSSGHSTLVSYFPLKTVFWDPPTPPLAQINNYLPCSWYGYFLEPLISQLSLATHKCWNGI